MRRHGLPLLAASAAALNNGKGFKPGMGFNTDYCMGCAGDGLVGGFQNDAYIRHIADFINASGMQALGYSYINMDASWNLPTRDANGNLQPDPKLWPNGISSVIDYVHSKGLGFGLYGDRGTKDCAGNPGNLGHETQDANYYASLEIDWYKSDSCYASADEQTAFQEYGTMRDALNATGRHIWFALCGWNTWYAPVGKSLGNSWRVGVDTGGGWSNVLENINAMLGLAQYAGPSGGGGGWNDMSLLLTPGMGSGANFITPARHRAQFTFHCIFAANMLTTGNLSALDPYVLETWMNAEAVAVNQDPAAHPFVVLPLIVTPDAAHDSEPEGYQFATVQECGGEPGAQNWTFGTPMTGFLRNEQSTLCLNVDSCATALIYDGCKTTGGTCAGPNSYANEQWALTPGGALQSALPGSRCATVAPNASSVSLAPCATPVPPSQAWVYLPATGELQTAGGLCLTVPPPPAPPSNTTTLLVGRALQGGSTWAVAALNNLPAEAVFSCGPPCFEALGVPAGANVTVRDLWLHADVGSTLALQYNFSVPGNGSSALLTFSLAPAAAAAAE